MTNYTEWSVSELRDRARALGVTGINTLRKGELIAAVEEAEARLPKDPADFGDMPDGIEAAPDDEAPAPPPEPAPAPEPAPEIGPEPDPPDRFRLMSDITLSIGGLPRKLFAGKILDGTQYDLDDVKVAGGVLVPILEKE